MSQFLPTDFQERSSVSTPTKGPEEYLSPDERKFIQRYLSFPEDLPPRFKSWLIDFIAVNIPQIPVSQIVGFQQFTASHAFVATTETRTSSTYGDLATVGPRLSGLADGQYIFSYGCAAWMATGGVGKEALMSIQVNGTTAAANDACVSENDLPVSVAIGVLKTIANGGNNVITAKYRSLDNATVANFARRWLVAQRIGN